LLEDEGPISFKTIAATDDIDIKIIRQKVNLFSIHFCGSKHEITEMQSTEKRRK